MGRWAKGEKDLPPYSYPMPKRKAGQRTIIAGSRSIVHNLPEQQQLHLDTLDTADRLKELSNIVKCIKERVLRMIDYTIKKNGIAISEVVSGCAPGVDTFAIDWALENNILVARFPAEWSKYGRSAGFRRNFQMAEYASEWAPGRPGQLIALWDGKSRGTKHMIEVGKKSGLTTWVVEL